MPRTLPLFISVQRYEILSNSQLELVCSYSPIVVYLCAKIRNFKQFTTETNDNNSGRTNHTNKNKNKENTAVRLHSALDAESMMSPLIAFPCERVHRWNLQQQHHPFGDKAWTSEKPQKTVFYVFLSKSLHPQDGRDSSWRWWELAFNQIQDDSSIQHEVLNSKKVFLGFWSEKDSFSRYAWWKRKRLRKKWRISFNP